MILNYLNNLSNEDLSLSLSGQGRSGLLAWDFLKGRNKSNSSFGVSLDVTAHLEGEVSEGFKPETAGTVFLL